MSIMSRNRDYRYNDLYRDTNSLDDALHQQLIQEKCSSPALGDVILEGLKYRSVDKSDSECVDRRCIHGTSPFGTTSTMYKIIFKTPEVNIQRRSNNSSSGDTVMATMSTCAGDHCYANPQLGEAVNELLKDNMPTTQDTGEISISGNNSQTKTDQLLLTESDISNEDSCSEEMRFFNCDIVNTPSDMPDVTVVVKIEQTNTPLCGECGNEFKTNFGVTIHKFRTQHSFYCHYCSIVFTKYREFRKHIRIHEGRPVAQCEICKRKFYGRYRDCTQHMKRVHQGQQAALKPTKPQTN